MDILSVRRKALAAREAAVGAQAPSSPSSTSPGPAVVTTSLPMRAAVTTSLPMPAAVTTSLPMPAAVTTSLPMPAALASASALPMLASSTMPSPSTTQPAPAASVPRRPTGLPADAGDPLQGFLAADDIDDEGIDDESERDFVEQGQRFLAFRIGAEEYAATIMDIKEILPVRAVTEVPRAPPDVLGVVSRRGVVVPLVDLGASLGLRAADRAVLPQQRVLIAGEGDRACGLRVDRVSEVVRLLPSSIEPVPASLGPRNAGLLLGLGRVGKRLFILLDVPAVLDALAVSVGLPTQLRGERQP